MANKMYDVAVALDEKTWSMTVEAGSRDAALILAGIAIGVEEGREPLPGTRVQVIA
jgi:hypothetical protein